MTELPTSPIREEHRELVPHLRHIETAAVGVWSWNAEEAGRRLPSIVAFLRDQLIPHAELEEAVLYPEIDRITGGPTTATMTLDHVEIGARIDRLAASVSTAIEDWGPDVAADLSRQLASLAAIVVLHFEKEEEALLPLLDEALTNEAATELFARMGHDEHTHTH